MKTRIAALVTFAALGCIVTVACLQAQPQSAGQQSRKPQVTVSEATTHFTAPLHASGYVDFAAAINSRLRQGVSADNNACIPLYEAIGPHTVQIDMADYLWGPRQIEAFFQDIGAPARVYTSRSALDELRPTSSRHRHFQDYVHPDSRFDDVFRLLHDAARRDRYYSPLITNAGGDDRFQILAGASYPSDIAIRCAAELLLKRAKATSDRDSSWQDILASYRLGRLVGMGPEVEDALLGMQIERDSIAAALNFLERFRPDAAALRRCRYDLGNIPARSPVSEKVDLAERCKCLDSLLSIACYGDPTTPNHGYPGAGGGIGEVYNVLIRHGMGKPEWDPALIEINKSYDDVVRILGLPTHDERRKGIQGLERQWQRTRATFTPPDRGEFSKVPGYEMTPEYREQMETVSWLRLQVAELTKGVDKTAKVDEATKTAGRAALKIAGRATAVMFQPAYVRAEMAEQRTRQFANNLELAVALAEYYASHSTYPKRLEELEPKHIAKIPLDVFSDQLPVYRPLENGFLLYSVGENQRDDGGGTLGSGADDLGVRMENSPEPVHREAVFKKFVEVNTQGKINFRSAAINIADHQIAMVVGQSSSDNQFLSVEQDRPESSPIALNDWQFPQFIRGSARVIAGRADAVSVLEPLSQMKVVGTMPHVMQAGDLMLPAVSPNGKVICTRAKLDQLQLFDAQTTQPIGSPIPQTGRVLMMEFTSDSKYLCSCADDEPDDFNSANPRPIPKTNAGDDGLRIWNAKTGELVAAFGKGISFRYSGSIAAYEPIYERVVTVENSEFDVDELSSKVMVHSIRDNKSQVAVIQIPGHSTVVRWIDANHLLVHGGRKESRKTRKSQGSYHTKPLFVVELADGKPNVVELTGDSMGESGIASDGKHIVATVRRPEGTRTICWPAGQVEPRWECPGYFMALADRDWMLVRQPGGILQVRLLRDGRLVWERNGILQAKVVGQSLWLFTADGYEVWQAG